MDITGGPAPHLHQCPARSETRLFASKRDTVDTFLLKDPNLYPRFKFALPQENKESFPLKGKMLLKTLQKLHCRSGLSL